MRDRQLHSMNMRSARSKPEPSDYDREEVQPEFPDEKGSRRGRRWGTFLASLLIVLFAAVICLAFYLFYVQGTSTRRPANRYRGNISVYKSSTDMDGDGTDDQTDILQGALAYVKTRPQYLSKYYASGYPDDGYGVCTDVVAFALKNAGYDLQELVDTDITNNPGVYNIYSPDRKIDFRRVANLDIYFRRYAISLTTDLTQVDEWQGGDIVTFYDHIGIVSDRRNADGVPYLIHHSGPLQKRYEEDFLGSRSDILGHYRIS